MALFDLLGRRWTLRVIWELRSNNLTFRELQELCDAMSPSVLNQRLTELREAGVVGVADEGGYRLTEEGKSLLKALGPLSDCAKRWGRRRRIVR